MTQAAFKMNNYSRKFNNLTRNEVIDASKYDKTVKAAMM